MTFKRWVSALWVAVMLSTSCSHSAPQLSHQRADSGGVVVETVAEGSAAARADIRPKDVLMSWERPAAQSSPPSRGTFTSPFDIRETEIEQSPRAPVTIHATREDKPFSVTLPAGAWELAVSPLRLQTPEAETWALAKQGDGLVTAGRLGEAEPVYASAIAAAQPGGPSLTVAVTEWMATALGTARGNRRRCRTATGGDGIPRGGTSS